MDISKLDTKLSTASADEVNKLIYVLEPLDAAATQLKTYKDIYAVKLLAEEAVESANKILNDIWYSYNTLIPLVFFIHNVIKLRRLGQKKSSAYLLW